MIRPNNIFENFIHLFLSAWWCDNLGILSWVYQTLVKCGDHVIPT